MRLAAPLLKRANQPAPPLVVELVAYLKDISGRVTTQNLLERWDIDAKPVDSDPFGASEWVSLRYSRNTAGEATFLMVAENEPAPGYQELLDNIKDWLIAQGFQERENGRYIQPRPGKTFSKLKLLTHPPQIVRDLAHAIEEVEEVDEITIQRSYEGGFLMFVSFDDASFPEDNSYGVNLETGEVDCLNLDITPDEDGKWWVHTQVEPLDYNGPAIRSVLEIIQDWLVANGFRQDGRSKIDWKQAAAVNKEYVNSVDEWFQNLCLGIKNQIKEISPDLKNIECSFFHRNASIMVYSPEATYDKKAVDLNLQSDAETIFATILGWVAPEVKENIIDVLTAAGFRDTWGPEPKYHYMVGVFTDELEDPDSF
jgi:hypothetical protein